MVISAVQRITVKLFCIFVELSCPTAERICFMHMSVMPGICLLCGHAFSPWPMSDRIRALHICHTIQYSSDKHSWWDIGEDCHRLSSIHLDINSKLCYNVILQQQVQGLCWLQVQLLPRVCDVYLLMIPSSAALLSSVQCFTINTLLWHFL